jgi:hypothetical protein
VGAVGQGRQPPEAGAAGPPLQRLPTQPRLCGGSMSWLQNLVVADITAAEERHHGAERSTLSELTNSACGNGVRQSTAASADEVSCRMFLCVRCRSQVLVCRRCDRGQIYCIGTCAKEARRERQREARRRHQATARGRAMHADRNRRYRARVRCVTDHGVVKAIRRSLWSDWSSRL